MGGGRAFRLQDCLPFVLVRLLGSRSISHGRAVACLFSRCPFNLLLLASTMLAEYSKVSPVFFPSLASVMLLDLDTTHRNQVTSDDLQEQRPLFIFNRGVPPS